MTTSTTPITLEIPKKLGGMRLDQALQQLLPEHSRSRLQAWIRDGLITVEAHAEATAKLKVWGGERVHITPQELPQASAFRPENIPIDIIYEDEQLLVVNKPAGLVVHPAAGNWSGTLLNALLYHRPQQQALLRAGIVHRLDKDTSGLLVVARTEAAQRNLMAQLQARTVKREYRTIVWGSVWRDGTVDQPIGRHPRARTRMAVRQAGRRSITHYEVLERFAVHTYLRCLLETGRTHQIRVHMQHLCAPLVGDPVYGLRGIKPRRTMTPALMEAVAGFKRQALHAYALGLLHPATAVPMHWQVELPTDMKTLLEAMRTERAIVTAPADADVNDSADEDFDDSALDEIEDEDDDLA